LDFVEKTGRQIKEQFKQDMRMVAKQDRLESVAITEAVENNSDIQSYITHPRT
jgi:hypothetical protein